MNCISLDYLLDQIHVDWYVNIGVDLNNMLELIMLTDLIL